MKFGNVEILNCDCMDYMRDLKDNAFDLAIVDPPYGLNCHQEEDQKDLNNRFHNRCLWDEKPSDEYFYQLFRISKAQIIWGGNNFRLPASEYFCIWDKKQTVDNFASAEYAFVSMSLKKPAKVFRYSIHQHNASEGNYKIHPTQKPIKLYQWILKNYAQAEQRIIDTHLGSGSSAIAAHYFGCDFVGCEIDEEYYFAAIDRFEKETAQLALI